MKDTLIGMMARVMGAERQQGRRSVAEYEYRRGLLALLFLMTVELIALVFGLLNIFFFGMLLLGIVELVVFAIVLAFLLVLRKHHSSTGIAWIAIAVFGGLVIFFYYHMMAGYSASVWLLGFPMLTFYLLGTRKGTLVYTAFGAIILSIIYSNHDQWAALENPGAVSNIVGSLVAVGMLIYFQEKTRENAYERITEIANTDGLTGIANRRHFIEQLSLAANGVMPQDTSIALLLVDIDNFKRINDSYGHPAGDWVIQQVSRRIASAVRKGDQLGRLGGEEFGVLIIGCDRTAAEQRAEQIREAVSAQPIVYEEHHIPTTVSVGVVVGRFGEDNFNGLFMQADKRLYAAKAQGRNRVVTVTADEAYQEKNVPLSGQGDRPARSAVHAVQTHPLPSSE